MRTVLKNRGLRLIFAANLVSMFGSGLNGAAVSWHVLQETQSELNLALLVVLQTIPALMLLPFSGVLIDREDRRRLLMWFDVVRGLSVALVTLLALTGNVRLWHLYVMNAIIATGFWFFWPTITALIQEVSPEADYIQSNALLMAGVQGGWLMAGAVVGLLYREIGLGGILAVDVLTYVASCLLYFSVRRGKHVVSRPETDTSHLIEGAVARFRHEFHEGIEYLRLRRDVLLIGTSWALFLSAILTQGVITAPLSAKILERGVVGFGWLNAGWGTGAFAGAALAAFAIRRFSAHKTLRYSMLMMTLCMLLVPFSRWLAIAVFLYLILGLARSFGSVAATSSLMETVPKHMMGRVLNPFYFGGLVLQLIFSLLVGLIAQRWSLAGAFGVIAAIYALAGLLTLVPARKESVPSPS